MAWERMYIICPYCNEKTLCIKLCSACPSGEFRCTKCRRTFKGAMSPSYDIELGRVVN